MAMPSMLGSYPVERELGRGGMGVVYLARDPRLGRQVAIKIVPDALALNPDNLARFEREAKLLAAVSHPNVAAVYGVEEIAGSRDPTPQSDGASGLQARGWMLVMEYVPGETLSDRLASGPMPVREALDVGRQVAAGIEAAHEGGIIHRDLKPGNIRLTPDGTVKVLDFGLAKGSIAASADIAQSPTLTYSPTAVGVILGTAAYMSPEQARGKTVDRRTDVWAFGCVLYECLTGRKAFDGETVSDTIARILEREPAWDAVPASTPARVRELLGRCLEKDLKKRQRDIGDVRIELEELAAVRGSMSAVTTMASEARGSEAKGRRWLWLGGVGLFAAGAAAGVSWMALGRPAPASAPSGVSLSITVPSNMTAGGAEFNRTGAFVLVRGAFKRADGSEDPEGRLFRRSLNNYTLEPIAGTEGLIAYTQSPDGQWLGVVKPVSALSAESRLWKVSVDGSAPPAPITDWDPQWFDLIWLGDGDILTQTAQQTKFLRIPSNGGSPQAETRFEMEGGGGYPRFWREIPGGKVLMRVESWGARGYQLDIWLLDPATGKARRYIENAGNPIYEATTSQLFYSRGSVILAASLDPATQTLGSEHVALFDGLRSNSWNHGLINLSREGHLLFEPGGRLGLDRRLVTVNAAREISPFIPDQRSYESSLFASPDGRQAAVVIPNARGTYETWVADPASTGLRRVISFPNADAAGAIWSPDGQWLAFTRNGRDAEDGVYIRRADGSGNPRAVLKTSSPDVALGATDWGPAGILALRAAGSTREILLIPMSADGEPGEPTRLVASAGLQPTRAKVSPDGRLLAYITNDSGRTELSVAELVNGTTVGRSLVVSNGGGFEPQWSADSKRLYFRQPPARVMSAAVERAPALRASAPTPVADLRALRVDSAVWDVLPDGRLLGIQLGAGEGDVTSYNVVLNWLAGVRDKLK